VDGQQHVSDQATIWRWHEAFQHDFAARMDWTTADYGHANHRPSIEVNGEPGTTPIVIDAQVGKPVLLDASHTRDPDSQSVRFSWFHYAEADGGTDANLAAVAIAGADTPKAVVTPTAVYRPKWLPNAPCSGSGTAHIILAVTDDGSPSLTSYRRIILNVAAP
jgi:hypothetical protein